MKAIGYTQPQEITQPDALTDIDLPMPEASGRDLLVKIDAISVNPVDTKIRNNVAPEAGQYKILGWDAVGEVIAVGDQVEYYQPGDKVWYAGDLTRPGTNAEFHLVDERIVGARPESLSNAEAAALPLTAITAWELLFDRLGITQADTPEKNGEQRLLIVGAAGGVGSVLVQLAARLTNATVIATASRPESQAWVKALGADYVIDHRKPLSSELQRIGINDVTHAASLNATDQHYAEIVNSLAPQGKLGLIDDPALPLDIKLMKMKSISLHWEFMYTRSMFTTDDIEQQRNLLNRVAGLIDSGQIQTTLGEHYGKINAANLKRAHASIESGTAIGKVVLEGF
ncbi:zinc-binding alcohol dehydrogenase family protein [Neptuniibacter halophilus]|uniref:zinc-binding alcohol dehydrogenase family protein n=1 Tax=Neptuniibacter halophilus TaxID=651666 RepID=UPI002574036D|nr:zinc-binding alcohol dehydrogenase family protein [Neptuniibacter halophilus]